MSWPPRTDLVAFSTHFVRSANPDRTKSTAPLPLVPLGRQTSATATRCLSRPQSAYVSRPAVPSASAVVVLVAHASMEHLMWTLSQRGDRLRQSAHDHAAALTDAGRILALAGVVLPQHQRQARSSPDPHQGPLGACAADGQVGPNPLGSAWSPSAAGRSGMSCLNRSEAMAKRDAVFPAGRQALYGLETSPPSRA